MSFNEIKGQEQAIQILKAYLNNEHLAGGYVFTGLEGVGKRMAAKALAKGLNCQDKNLNGCSVCSSCVRIENNQHPDVHIISSDEAQIKIDAVRQLQKEMNLRAYEGGYKVFIIDNAHTLTPEASNCLLKVLEEPPKNNLIILITDKPSLLFKTITSRCKIIKFLPFKRENLESILENDYKIDKDYAHFLAYFSEGRFGSALRFKDDEVLSKRNNIIDKFILAANPSAELFASQSREDVRGALNFMSSWFRDIYMLKIGCPQRDIINSDRSADLSKQALTFSFLELDKILNNISVSISYLEKNVNSRLLMYNLGMELWKG